MLYWAKGILNKIVIIGLVIIALSFTAGLASSGFNFAEAAGGWKPAVNALIAQITGLGDRTSDLEDEVFCSGNGTYDSVSESCTCDGGFTGLDCSETVSVCGNGIVESGETCDDGNIVDSDGCSSTCQTEGECSGASAGTVCRASAGDCDVVEVCDGVTTVCPADAFEGATTFCGNTTDDSCSNPDTCDGAGTCLPNDEPSSTVCSGGFCDGTGICEITAVCGDGIRTGDEVCEGSDVGTALCTDLGFTGGALGCTGTCEFDTNSCTS